MTDDDWTRCRTKPTMMYRGVWTRLSARRLQLLACALVRLLPGSALHPWADAIEIAERFADADNPIPTAEFRAAAERVRHACDDLELRQAVYGDVAEELIAAATAVQCAVGTANLAKSIPLLMEHVQRHDQLTTPRGQKQKAREAMLARQCDVVREIVLPPGLQYRIGNLGLRALRTPGQGWAVIREPALGIADGIHHDQAFDRLPVLADALEEHDLTDIPILDHLRSGGPHARGCWALDLILGRG
jgi:hypothetical protein